ncbi:substrate-binding domain-containing protein [Sphingobacterium corticis]|uniref:Substrate-binding domain-containing protein n=1 Tax=Sphingobacterium corticis TaxID=1812823 RepID=A0ABW5NGZ2_9SPHI
MAKYLNILIMCACAVGILSSCGNSSDGNGQANDATSNDILTGNMTVIADETVTDLLNQQMDVFKSSYTNSQVELITDLERPAINRLLRGEGQVAILKRKLTAEEAKGFEQRSIKPKIFPIAFDAVVFAVSSSVSDSTINFDRISNLLNGSEKGEQKLLVDNINSSTIRTLQEVSNVNKVSGTNVSELRSAKEVLTALANNKKGIGVLSYNQYLAMRDSLKAKDKIRILSVSKSANEAAYRPTQTTLGDDTYPLKQEVYVLNYQPNMGLGIGFSAFLTGDRGQRVVLKYGLLPATMPGRELIIRDEANF